MKIAYVVRNYNIRGGISGYVAELAGRVSIGNEVHVFASAIEGAPGNIKRHIVPVLTSEYLKKMKKYSWNVALEVAGFMARARSYVRKESFDIIHSQGDYSGECDVYTAHSCHKAWLSVARDNAKGLMEKLKKSEINPLHKIIIKSEYFAIMKSRKIIAISNGIKNELSRYYPSSAGKIEVIPNGVDIKRFSKENMARWRAAVRGQYKLKSDDIVAIFPAHEFERKGLCQIIEALSELKNYRLYLLVVGRDNPSKYGKEIDDRGLAERIIFAGEQPETEKYYAAADMLILPALYEPFGLVITEAMACGLPAIVSANAGAAELITDGFDGLLLKDRNDTKELALKVKWLMDNKDSAAGLGENARRTAEKYSWETIAGKTYSLYETILREKTR